MSSKTRRQTSAARARVCMFVTSQDTAGTSAAAVAAAAAAATTTAAAACVTSRRSRSTAQRAKVGRKVRRGTRQHTAVTSQREGRQRLQLIDKDRKHGEPARARVREGYSSAADKELVVGRAHQTAPTYVIAAVGSTVAAAAFPDEWAALCTSQRSRACGPQLSRG